MVDWIETNWTNVLIIALVIGVVVATTVLTIYFAKLSLFLWNKRVLLVDKKYFTELTLIRERLYAEHGDIPIEHLSSLFEALSTVVEHKDKVIKATGESLKKLDGKLDAMTTTVANLEEINKELRNRESVINNLKSIKLLLALSEEVEKFASDSSEKYLGFVHDNLQTVLLGLGVEPFDDEFLYSDELLKYYKSAEADLIAPFKIDKQGYLVRLPDSVYVLKQAIISSKGE